MTAATLICYALYTVDEDTLVHFGSHAMLITVTSVMDGLLRYVYLIYRLDKGEDPTGALYRDWPSLLNLAIWILLVLAAIQFGPMITLLI